MQTVRAMLLIFVGLIGVSLAIVLFIALIPLLWFISYLVGALLVAGSLYLIALGLIDLRGRLIRSSIVPIPEYGSWHNKRGVLHRPLELAAPVTVTEERDISAEDREIIDRSRVLTAHFDEGKGMHKIEKELGISYDKVRHWVNTAEALRKKQQQSW